MAQLGRTFPNLDLAIDMLAPRMDLVASNEYIELFTYSEVIEISGYIGNFDVKIKKKARLVDSTKCDGCGICWEKCPMVVDSEFDYGLNKRKDDNEKDEREDDCYTARYDACYVIHANYKKKSKTTDQRYTHLTKPGIPVTTICWMK